MRVLTGTVTDLKSGSRVVGGGNNSSVGTLYSAVFKIDGQTIVIEFPGPILLDEGEDVRVAGEMKQGALRVYAYRNITTGTTGSQGDNGYIWLAWFVGAFVGVGSLAGFFLLAPYRIYVHYRYYGEVWIFEPSALLFFFLSACFMPPGVFFLLAAIKIRSAIEAIR